MLDDYRDLDLHPTMISLLAALLVLPPQHVPTRVDSARVAREAVAQFYAWYVPAAHTAGAEMRALRNRRWHFSPTLVAALRADSAAAHASPGEVVGLDMDPFLNAQDPCNHYAPTGVRRAGETFLVDVAGSGGCGLHPAPDVTVQVAFTGATPTFVNFHYPKPAADDLLHLLRSQAADRVKKSRP